MRVRGLLVLVPLLLLPVAGAHADASDHGRAFVSEAGDGVATRLVPGCAFFVEARLAEGPWDAGRVLVLASHGAGGLRVAAEAPWNATPGNGTLAVGPLDAGPGTFLVGVELDARHGAYSEAFRVDCMEPICPPEGCPTLRVSSTAQGAPRSAVALLAALAGVAALGVLVAWRG